MKKIAVIYKTKYGATKKYAQWIAEELKADLYENAAIKTSKLNEYDVIVYGGGLYAGGVNGISLITKNYQQIKDKNVIVFTCGLADTMSEENVKGIRDGIKKVFTLEMQNNITLFHLRGAMDYKKLGLVHRAMMAMMKRVVSKKDSNSLRQEDKQMLETYGKVVDFTDRATITPLIDFVRNK